MGVMTTYNGTDVDFLFYEPSTNDPGWKFTLSIVMLCVLLNLMIPLFVGINRFLHKRKQDPNDASAPVISINEDTSNTHRHEEKEIKQEQPSTMQDRLPLPPSHSELADSSSCDASLISDSPSVQSVMSDIIAGVLSARPTRKKQHRHGIHRLRMMESSSAQDSSSPLDQASVTSVKSVVTNVGEESNSRDEQALAAMDDTVDGDAETRTIEHSLWECILLAADWDTQTKQLLKLFLPYSLQAIIEGIFEIIDLALIGSFLGVQAANVWVIVGILLEFTSCFNYGFAEAVGTLAPQATGAGNKDLAGRYLQLSIIFYTFGNFPSVIIWAFWTEDVVLWFGFDDDTAAYAQRFVFPYLINYVLGGLDECVFEFLDAMGHEKYATIIELVHSGSCTLIILLMAMLGINDLIYIALAQAGWSAILTVANFGFIVYSGWLNDYWQGFAEDNALRDGRAVRTMMITAIPLSISWILTNGEWEVLTVFVRYMGPAEVAAWGIMGYVWDTFEQIVGALCDAVEVRVGFQMGAGLTNMAKATAYKAIYLGSVVAALSTAFMFIVAEQLPKWLTPDPMLQRMIFETLPLLGFGLISMSIGSVCWSVVEGQGRVRLATTIEMLTSWLVVIPLSYLFVFAFKYNLLGVVAALVVAYTITGQFMGYLVVTSDWTSLSATVVQRSDGAGVASDYSNERTCPNYDDFDWDDLPTDAQAAAAILGYTRKIWDKGGTPASVDKYWNQLSQDQQSAAQTLGFNEETWNLDSRDRKSVV